MALLLLLLACVPEPSPSSTLAGCTMVETHTTVGRDDPWSRIERQWDGQGRLVLHRRALDPETGVAPREEQTWIYIGDLLVEETTIAWEGSGDAPPPYRTTHTYDAAATRLTSTEWVGDRLVGTWSWGIDATGHPSGGTWDAGDDGEIDGTRVEVWDKEPFGWRVTSEEVVGSLPSRLVERELDEEERELWRSEDWDDDGVSEVVEQHTYDDEGNLVAWDLSGAARVDESCVYRWIGLQQVAATCADALHPGWFDWVWIHDAGRPRRAVVTHVSDDGATEAWENVTYAWECS